MNKQESVREFSIDKEQLFKPIPNLSVARAAKEDYRDHPIDQNSPLFYEELVNIADFGLAGQAYYSRYNQITRQPIEEVPKDVYLRLSLAEKLARINDLLRQPFFSHYFGGPVELYIEDGLRSSQLQRSLCEKIIPDLIRQQNPGISDENLEHKLKDLIAPPSTTETSPAPHATGGAVDVILRYQQGSREYNSSMQVLMGYKEGDTSKRTYPDYFELMKPQTLEDKLARDHRRVFYAVMTGKAFGGDTQLQVNPTEWWHWSYGDQMWAKLQHQPSALYGIANTQT